MQFVQCMSIYVQVVVILSVTEIISEECTAIALQLQHSLSVDVVDVSADFDAMEEPVSLSFLHFMDEAELVPLLLRAEALVVVLVVHLQDAVAYSVSVETDELIIGHDPPAEVRDLLVQHYKLLLLYHVFDTGVERQPLLAGRAGGVVLVHAAQLE